LLQLRSVVGRIPMRHLVYRVQALPQSMLPLVWDFGQLSTAVEKLYIRQMVNRYVSVITKFI
jgi:E3 ubiquitin-protein ligase RNF213